MKDYAVLTNVGKYTIFEFNNQRNRFITSDKLGRYTKVVEWDNGYLVVMAKYKEIPEVEEYIDVDCQVKLTHHTFLSVCNLHNINIPLSEYCGNTPNNTFNL